MTEQAIKAIVRVRPFTPKELSGKAPFPAFRVEQEQYVHIDKGTLQMAEQAAGGFTTGSGTVSTTSKEKTIQGDSFQFDKVLWSIPQDISIPDGLQPPTSGQCELFEAAGMPAVENILKGYNVSIFAYGQTGSGKSHTVFGPTSDPGLAPRIVQALFDQIHDLAQIGAVTEVELSCFEIYNEKIADLLTNRVGLTTPVNMKERRRRSKKCGAVMEFCDSPQMSQASPISSHIMSPIDDFEPPTAIASDPDDDGLSTTATTDYDGYSRSLTPAGASAIHGVNASSVTAIPSMHQVANLKVRQHPDLGVFVEGLRKEIMTDASSVISAIYQSLDHRVTASTNMNSQSSRSHAVIQISVDMRDEAHGKRIQGMLNLVDLAGSERISRSGVVGKELNEAKNINLSLTTLRRVIDIIADNIAKKQAKGVPPFRESALTWILMDCFGGASVTMMIAAVSPHIDNVLDTIGTLRYASKCKKIVNTCKANEVKIAMTMYAIQLEMERVKKEMRWADENRQGPTAEEREAMLRAIKKRKNVAKLLTKSVAAKEASMDTARLLLEQFNEENGQTFERLKRLKNASTMKTEYEEEILNLSQEAIGQKALAREVLRQYRKFEEMCCMERKEISDFLGVKGYDTNEFIKSRRRDIKKQLLEYARDMKHESQITEQCSINEALKSQLYHLKPLLRNLNEDIVQQQKLVDSVSHFEKEAKVAAQTLIDVHRENNEAAESFREETRAIYQQKDECTKMLKKIDDDIIAERRKQGDKENFSSFILKDLEEEKSLINKKLADSAIASLEARHLDVCGKLSNEEDGLKATFYDLEADFLHGKRIQEMLDVINATIADNEKGLAEDTKIADSVRERHAALNEEIRNAQLELYESHDSIKSMQTTTRKRCFPDARAQYFDRVLSQIAIDLQVGCRTEKRR